MSIFAIYLLFSMLAVMWFDATKFIIPNWLVGSLLLLYPLAVYMAPHPVDWKMALAAMGMVFAVGYVVFALNWMGGGDIKLITVCALWVGFEHLLDFLFLTGILGGVLSVALYGIRKFEPHMSKKRPMPRILREGEPAPYGLAISAAILILLYQGNVEAIGMIHR